MTVESILSAIVEKPLRTWTLIVCSATLLAAAGSLASCTASAPEPVEATAKTFVGSAACQSCHQDIYARWKDTLMANVLQDAKARPEAILGDFSSPNPLVTFSRDEISHTYGSRWKQRYYTRVGDDFFVFPAQWDVRNKVWRQYYVRPGTDWWTSHYPADQMQRPTGPLCDGCHSVNFDIRTQAVTEWNVGCEKCHGAGSAHMKQPVAATIINPTKLDDVRADDVCIQCHSQGQPKRNPIEGRYYDWPVGYQPGDRLSDLWRLEEHHLGEETFTHWPEGSAHKNRMQGNDYVQSQMYVKGVRCYACHDTHGTEHEADLRLSGNAVCLQCHNGVMQPGPRGTVEFHTQHAANSEGSKCVACHMPAIAQTIANVNVRSHTFRFISPAVSERNRMPNPCTSCHTDKTNEWATEALARWPGVSPWRVAQ